MSDRKPRGLVLGGGGVAGIAWEYGLLAALEERGVDLNDADVVVGTSAGSVVGTALRSDAVRAMYDSQFVPIETEAAEMAGFDVQELMAVFAEAQQETDDTAARALIGRYALTVPQERMPEATRIAMLESQLPSRDWPERVLRVTAVDAETGAFVVYDARAGAPLGRAIMASCSIPGVGPTMPIGGRLLMDGGIRSGTNADVADDCDRVIVIACNPEPERSATGPTLAETVATRASGSTFVIEADQASRAAFGPNPLLMSSRAGSAEAGFAQGTALAEELAAFWS